MPFKDQIFFSFLVVVEFWQGSSGSHHLDRPTSTVEFVPLRYCLIASSVGNRRVNSPDSIIGVLDRLYICKKTHTHKHLVKTHWRKPGRVLTDRDGCVSPEGTVGTG